MIFICLAPQYKIVILAGRGHASVSGGVDFQRVIKRSVETWPKKACVSTLLLRSYLIIS